jgi:NhaP-type Na+/H+ or K+/H+ antiporter
VGVDWSGIVAIVAAGFFMDIYVIGSKIENDDRIEYLIKDREEERSKVMKVLRSIFSQEGYLSTKSKSHIGFVSEINSTIMETAIFAYLGLFLFSKRYHWTFMVPFMAVLSCVFSRTVMITYVSCMANWITKLSRTCSRNRQPFHNQKNDVIDAKMQLVLIFAGLRGAMSFALVETIPMYDSSDGTGSRLKPELKAMTSASIVFSVFVMGGYTYYLLERLGISIAKSHQGTNTEMEMAPLTGPASSKQRSKVIKDDTSVVSFASDSSRDLTYRHKAQLR